MRVSMYTQHRHHQSGLVVAIVTLAMFSLIGIAALAIDVNHALMNKSRLQNSVDAAALAAAIVLDNEGTSESAKSAAEETLTKMALSDGNDEMEFDFTNLEVLFSDNAKVFSSDSTVTSPRFVRVSINDYPLYGFFTDIFDIAKSITASAVAGPSPGAVVANVVPMAVCEGKEINDSFYGYSSSTIYALKLPSSSGHDDPEGESMGPGNFQLLDLSSTDGEGNIIDIDYKTNSGASSVRDGLAGHFYGQVKIGGTVDTKPGASTGPVGQGLNTRLDSDDDMTPPDQYIKEPTTKARLDNNGEVVYEGEWYYADYLSERQTCFGESQDTSLCPVNGQPDRRILPVPIVDCSSGVDDSENGKTTYRVTAIGCFFLLQKAPTNNSGKDAVYGEFISECEVTGGMPGSDSNNDGPYRIVLYEDPYSEDS